MHHALELWGTACEGIAVLAWTLMMLAVVPVDDVARRVGRVEAAYRAGGAMTADFRQTYRDSLRAKPRVESGRLWVAAGGQVRWAYLAPERKEFIFDGETAYFYEPEQAQVTILRHFRGSPLAAATEFLWGRGDLRRQFSVADCEPPPAGVAPAAPVPAGEMCVAMRPRQPMPQVHQIVLGIDEATPCINRSWVIDAVGNTTELAFTQVRFGQALDPAMFRFTPPPGVSILEPSVEAAP